MKTDPTIARLPRPPEIEAVQFEALIDVYRELGLNHDQASAAAQADFLCGNRLAFRRRGSLDGSYYLVGSERAAA